MDSALASSQREFLIKRRPVSNSRILTPHSTKPTHLTKPTKQVDEPLDLIDNNSKTVSTWGVGRYVPLMMGSSFLFASLIVVTHIVFFNHIDGKPSDGEDRFAPQSYVLTASNILANIYGLSLNVALALAFCQYLWRVVRLSALKLSTVEVLFSLRSNPLLLFHGDAIHAAPPLFLIAILMWGIQVATSFPTGALTIVSANQTTHSMMSVPTFNASFVGDGSVADATKYALGRIVPGGGILISWPNSTYVESIAMQTMITGEPIPMPSPCGANCSYIIEFEGPSFDCVSVNNITSVFSPNGLPESLNDTNEIATRSYTGSRFELSAYYPNQSIPLRIVTYYPFAANTNQDDFLGTGNSTGGVIGLKSTTDCVYSRAKYTVNNSYANNIQTLSSSAQRLGPLTLDHIQFLQLSSATPGNWSAEAMGWYRGVNEYNIALAVVQSLIGSDSSVISITEPFNQTSPLHFQNYTVMDPPLASGNDLWTYDVKWVKSLLFDYGNWSANFEPEQTPGMFVRASRFCSLFQQNANPDPDFNSQRLSFNVTQDGLNSLLLNTTISTITAYSLSSTQSNTTRITTHNVYSFSRPLNIFLPYFLTLTLSIPLLIIGIAALVQNGVSAMDGSFLQIVTTTAGSRVLHERAVGGCLGGKGNLPVVLIETKVKFGELLRNGVERNSEGERLRKAGFGVEEEVVDLRKGGMYGIDIKDESSS